MVDGLGTRATYQSFPSHELALENYFTARTKGFVQVVRLPGDSEEVFGHPDYAEDI
jgi:hypothetical protein